MNNISVGIVWVFVNSGGEWITLHKGKWFLIPIMEKCGSKISIAMYSNGSGRCKK